MSETTELVSGKTTLAAALVLDIMERRGQSLRKKISAYPRTVSILSDIGECDRQMTYHITNWKDKPLHDEVLQARFDAGRLQESELVRELLGLGYEVISGQEVVEIKNRQGEVIGRGKIDGKINYHRIKIPFEIKSMNVNIYEGIDTIEDFKKKPYLRKYLKQIQMYLFGNNVEEGLLMITDCLGHWKIFVVTLDFGEAEHILQRLERVHAAIKSGTIPDRIEYREEICGKCAFMMICLQDVIRTEAEVLTNEDLIERLNVRESLKESASKYDKVDKSIKDELKRANIKKGLAGDFYIVAKEVQIAESAPKPAKPAYVQIRYDISRVKSNLERS